MAIPDFQTLMRPVLEAHADGADHERAPLRDAVAAQLGLSDEERAEMLASGRQRRFDNRLAWSLSYLAHAGLLERPRRGVTRLTERGQQILAEHPGRVDMAFLEQFPEYRQFRYGTDDTDVQTPGVVTSKSATQEAADTPEETLEASFETITEALAQELRDKLAATAPDFFEQVVVDVLVAMGYGGNRRDAAERLGQSGDGGVDGVIREDALGLDAIYLQAKRWDPARPVGRPEVPAFVGALHGVRASKGVFITTSRFTSDAREYAATVTPRVVLVDGRQLAHLMIEHNVGVAARQTYAVKRIDEDYFLEGDE